MLIICLWSWLNSEIIFIFGQKNYIMLMFEIILNFNPPFNNNIYNNDVDWEAWTTINENHMFSVFKILKIHVLLVVISKLNKVFHFFSLRPIVQVLNLSSTYRFFSNNFQSNGG